MCNFCSTPLTYAMLWNDIYNAGNSVAHQRSWITVQQRRLDASCAQYRSRFVQLLSIAMRTQTIFEQADPEFVMHVECERRNMRKLRLCTARRVTRRMLKHAYRPGGNMYRRTMERCIT